MEKKVKLEEALKRAEALGLKDVKMLDICNLTKEQRGVIREINDIIDEIYNN